MAINADKPLRWKEDIASSVDQFNKWFMKFAPRAYRESRVTTTKSVENTFQITGSLTRITTQVLEEHPAVLPTLRMATCPPLARDRLVGLAYANKNLVKVMEEGRIPAQMARDDLGENLQRIAKLLGRMLDKDIFPWLETHKDPTRMERHRAATVVADRLCGAVSDPIIRNAQEKRQLSRIASQLRKMGYRKAVSVPSEAIKEMGAGTFSFHTNIVVGDTQRIRIPVDVAIQPRIPRASRVPILIEAKSAGDFTNVNKRRKEEATKVRQLRAEYGGDTQLILFLCGYFDTGYLGYEAGEGIDWVWEHRIEDLKHLGL